MKRTIVLTVAALAASLIAASAAQAMTEPPHWRIAPAATPSKVHRPVVRRTTGLLPSWWVRDALCVHRYEGSWTDPNPPYWGGMQMDMGFMRHYGSWALARWGTADHWNPHVQLVVAYRGWRSQGWGAWPNSSRMCGL